MINWNGGQSVIENLDSNKASEVQKVLVEIGAKLSDVFGADQVLWVEGETEEECYYLIVNQLIRAPALGTSIVAVRNTGDFEGKRRSATLIWEIYSKISRLLPKIGLQKFNCKKFQLGL